MYIYLYNTQLTHIYTNTCVHIYVYKYIYTHIYIYIYVCNLCICMNMYIYSILKTQVIEVSAEFGPNYSAVATRHYHISAHSRHNITP